MPALALRCGHNASLSLPIPEEALVAHCAAPGGVSGQRVRELVRQALGEPLDYPPLAQTALPGDKVVLALAGDVPQAATIVGETIESLLAAGVEPGDIALISTAAENEPEALDPLGTLPADVRGAIAHVRHDPQDRQSLSYLAADVEGRPIYIHRALHDAEVVIPIGVLRLSGVLGHCGINAGLFPAFSDADSIRRFQAPKVARSSERARLCKAADEVGWLLGARFTIQVVPAADGDVLHVLSGDSDAVRRAGKELCEAAWSFSVPDRASLVVATLGADDRDQTWQNVGRALASAAGLLADEGAIVLCCGLDERPGPALSQLLDADDLDAAGRRILRERSGETLAACELVQALKRGKVYLLSRLDDDLVERLGMLPVDAKGVARLASRYGSCIVLENAQYALAKPAAEARSSPHAHEDPAPR